MEPEQAYTEALEVLPEVSAGGLKAAVDGIREGDHGEAAAMLRTTADTLDGSTNNTLPE